MEPMRVHRGRAAVLNRVNVDTDQIIPKQFLKRIERTGFGVSLFFDWRYTPDGSPNPEFELNQPESQGASILLAGHNFGCGSSREHAPWALLDYGFQVIIAPSFADIFYNNCVKNGILPIRLPEEQVQALMDAVAAGSSELEANLEEQVVGVVGGQSFPFDIDAHWRNMLLNGWDEIGLTMQVEARITTYEQQLAP